jgi:hypothetical protein
MLKLLSKTGFFLQFIVFLAIATILWFPTFIHPLPPVETDLSGPLFIVLKNWLQGAVIVSTSIAALLIISQAFLLHVLLSSHDLIPRDSFIDAIIFLVLMSWQPTMLCLHPALPAGFLVLLAIFMIMKMYGETDSYKNVFSASLSVGVAALFYQPAIYFMAGIWFSLFTYRITSWREWLITVMGLVLPLIYLFSYYYWDGTLSQGLDLIDRSVRIQFLSKISFTPVEMVFWIGALSAMVLSSLMTLNSIQDKVISIRRKNWIMFDFSLAGMLFLLVAIGTLKTGHYLVMMPLAYFLTYAAIAVKKSRINDLIVVAFILMVIVLHYLM